MTLEEFSKLQVKLRLIPGFVGYAVSKDGHVYSLWLRGARPILLGNRWRRLTPLVNTKDRLFVILRRDGKRYSRQIHRLVLESYVGPCPAGLEGCHNDGNHRNNDLENLRWGTRQSNCDDRRRHGGY